MAVVSTRRQRVSGAFGLAICLGFVVWEWQHVQTGGEYHGRSAFLFPAFAVISLALLLFPISREDLLERFGIERPSSLNHYSRAQKTLFVLAFVAGGLNWALISGTLNLD